MAFSFATCFIWLLAARMLLGMGVGICLMAPLTGYRCWFDASTLLRANPWMLMTGSLGVLASSVPVQWLMPLLGWRPMFWILALMIVLAIVCAVPRWRPGFFQLWRPGRHTNPVGRPVDGSSGSVHAAAGRHRPFLYQRGHAGYFLKLGTLNSWLAQYGSPADRLLLWGVPLSLVALAANIVFGTSIGYSVWAVFCIASSFQRHGFGAASGQHGFQAHAGGPGFVGLQPGDFFGYFCVHWALGLAIDAFAAAGLDPVARVQAAMGGFLCCWIASYAYFVGQPRLKVDNHL